MRGRNGQKKGRKKKKKKSALEVVFIFSLPPHFRTRDPWTPIEPLDWKRRAPVSLFWRASFSARLLEQPEHNNCGCHKDDFLVCRLSFRLKTPAVKGKKRGETDRNEKATGPNRTHRPIGPSVVTTEGKGAKMQATRPLPPLPPSFQFYPNPDTNVGARPHFAKDR